MSAYMIINLNPKDDEKLNQYSALAAETISKYGGEYAAKGPAEAVHGTLEFPVIVILRFPDRQHATDWYQSTDYQAIVALRDQAMDSQFQLLG
jgi:uncharacterized protein (DUF1330 family)